MTQTLTAAYIGALGVVTVGAAGCDFTAAALEPIIQQAIDLVSLESGLEVTHLSGAGGSMSAALSDDEIAAVALKAEILAINACLSRVQLPWPVDKAETMAKAIDEGGYITQQYGGLLRRLRAKRRPFVVVNPPIPGVDE